MCAGADGLGVNGVVIVRLEIFRRRKAVRFAEDLQVSTARQMFDTRSQESNYMAHTARRESPESQKRIDNANPALISHPSRAERLAMGKALREKCPRDAHTAWKPPHSRPEPVRLVLKADAGRLPDLIPLRHGRMVQSSFTFFRGSALAMADDLRALPPPASVCSAAETPTWSTSGASPLLRGDSFLPSTISTKRFLHPGSGTSSVLRRAS